MIVADHSISAVLDDTLALADLHVRCQACSGELTVLYRPGPRVRDAHRWRCLCVGCGHAQSWDVDGVVVGITLGWTIRRSQIGHFPRDPRR